jgi:hypothetical protein
MDNIESSYNYISKLYDNTRNSFNKRTFKQEQIRQEYLDELLKQINIYEKEKNELLLKYNKLETINETIQKKINYYNDKLSFRNIRSSSTSNFISLNINPLKRSLNCEIDTYNKNYKQMDLILEKIKNIDFYIYNTKMTINFYY